MRTTITIPDKQVPRIDKVADRLGLRRGQAIAYLLTQGLTIEQVRAATVDTGEGTSLLARLAEQEMALQNHIENAEDLEEEEPEDPGKYVPVPVTQEQGEINFRGRRGTGS